MSISHIDKKNVNYLAKIVKLDTLRKHGNADRLQIATIDFQQVITGLDAKVGDLYVYFPLECQIDAWYLSKTNSFRDKTLNADPEKAGFFDKTGRVKAVKLRDEKSMGYIVPLSEFNAVNGSQIDERSVGKEFDTVCGRLIVKKYYVRPQGGAVGASNKRKQKVMRVSRMVEDQFRLHKDTENLRKNVWRLKPNDFISVTHKLHGTSAVFGNVLVKRQLKWYEKLARWFGVQIQETEYDLVYSSRNVIKNECFNDESDGGYYGTNLWAVVAEEIKSKIPKGYTVYGEITGYVSANKMVQAGYDYGSEPGKHNFWVYRVTFTNADGIVTELSMYDIMAFCERAGLLHVPVLDINYAGEMCEYQASHGSHEEDLKAWQAEFIAFLERQYTETEVSRCPLCRNDVPMEGIVVRKDNLWNFDAYKLKCWAFLERETKQLDAGQSDMESEA